MSGGQEWFRANVPLEDNAWWALLAEDLSTELDLSFVVAESVMADEWEVVAVLPDGLQFAIGGSSLGDTFWPRVDYFGKTEFQRFNGSLDGPRCRPDSVGRAQLTGWLCDAVGLLSMLKAVSS